MSTYSKVALAIDITDWETVKPYVDDIIFGANIFDKETPDNTYRCIYWDEIVWQSPYARDILQCIEDIRHALITISEDGKIESDILTEDSRGCDGEFEEMLFWQADICFWSDGAPLSPRGRFVPMTRERILDVLRAYVERDAEACEASYVYEALTFAGCDDEEIKSLGFGYVIPCDE